MSRLIHLGRYLLLDLVKYWLSISDISKLEVACDKKSSTSLLKFISEIGSRLQFDASVDQNLHYSLGFYQWTNKRNIVFDHLTLSNFLMDHHLNLFIKNLQYVRSISYQFHFTKESTCNAENAILNDLFSKCTNLEEIELTNSGHILHGNIMALLLSVGNKFQKINFQRLTSISADTITHIGIICSRLTSINLADCPETVNETSFSEVITGNPKLTDINIANNILINNFNIDLIAKHCESLKTLNIKGLTALTSGCFLSLNKISTLTSLNISNCNRIVDNHQNCEYKLNCPSLTHLIMNHIKHMSESCITSFVENHPFLEHLSLISVNNIDMTVFYTIADTLHHLQRIQFHFDGIAHLEAAWLRLLCTKMKNITTLQLTVETIEGTPLSEEESRPQRIDNKLIGLAKHTTGGVCRNNQWNIAYTFDNTVHSVLHKCKRLHTLELNVKLSERIVIALFTQCCSVLRVFKAGFRKLLSDKELNALAKNCSTLRELNISGCVNISDDSFIKLVSQNKLLETINCDKCFGLTDSAVRAITTHCKRIKTLSLNNCDIGNKSVGFICNSSGSSGGSSGSNSNNSGLHLTSLSLINCSKITYPAVAMDNIRETCKELNLLNGKPVW